MKDLLFKKFFQLSLKKLMRSKNFKKKIFFKVLILIGYLFAAVYTFGIVIGSFFIIRKEFPDSDVFVKLNSFIYIFIFYVFYLMMFIPSENDDVRGFMLLPIKRNKIIGFHLFKNLVNPIIIIIFISILTLGIILISNGYNIIGIFTWLIALISTVITIQILLMIGEKNQITGAIFSMFFIIIIWKFKLITGFLKPIGGLYYKTYTNPIYTIAFVFISILSYFFIYSYINKRFYLDEGIKKSKDKRGKFENMELSWTKKLGKTGVFIKNDIRLITRSPRTRQLIIGGVFMILFGFFIFASPIYNKQVFWKVYGSFFITGYFVLSFGGLIPSWDGKYYKLLMSQNIKYREYLEAKWYLMIFSVIVYTILSIPLWFFGKEAIFMIIAMASVNMGFVSFVVLATGIFNTTAIDLDKKIRAFQANQNFTFKTFIIGMLRFLTPIIIYVIINKFWGINYALLSMILLGITGIMLRNYILDKIADLYKTRKHLLIAKYSSEDD